MIFETEYMNNQVYDLINIRYRREGNGSYVKKNLNYY